jgi:putative nucleotidyltransferase with HDIG domain
MNRKLFDFIHHRSLWLQFQQYKRSSRKNERSFLVIESLFSALDLRDPLTANHSLRVADYAYRLALSLDPYAPLDYFLGGLIHDIGKIGFTDHILKGTEIIPKEERWTLENHVVQGFQLISDFNLPVIALEMVRYHHESFDGTGYLEGRKGLDIPLSGRIAALADTYAALTSERPYKRSFHHQEAIQSMNEISERFDPSLLSPFNELVQQDVKEYGGSQNEKSFYTADGIYS